MNKNEDLKINIGNGKNKKIMSLSKFDIKESLQVEPKENKTFGCFLINGLKGSGKTILVKDLIQQLLSFNKIKNIMIFNHNEKQYSDITKDINKIQKTFNGETIDKIIEIQSIKNSPPLLLVLENIYLEENIKSIDSSFYYMLSNKKKLNITLIITSTQPFILKEEAMSLIDFSFIFTTSKECDFNCLKNYYFKFITNKEILKKLIYKINKYDCYVNVNLKNNTRIENAFMYYRVEDLNFSKINLISVKDIDLENTSLNDIHCKDLIHMININNEKIKELQEKNEYLLKMIKYKLVNV